MTGPPSPASLSWGRGVYGGPTQLGPGPRRCLPASVTSPSPSSLCFSQFPPSVCPSVNILPCHSESLSSSVTHRLSVILRVCHFLCLCGTVPSCLHLALFLPPRLSLSAGLSHFILLCVCLCLPPSLCLLLSLNPSSFTSSPAGPAPPSPQPEPRWAPGLL